MEERSREKLPSKPTEGNLVGGDLFFRPIAVLHKVGVFGGIGVMVSENGYGAELAGPEEELGRKIGFPYFQDDPSATLSGEFSDQFVDHLGAYAPTPILGGHGEVHQMNAGLAELIDHVADDLIFIFGDHANTIASVEAALEVFFGPGKFKALLFDGQDFRQIAVNHPSKMDTEFGLRIHWADSFLVRPPRNR